jgi:hypothetical protein
MGVVDFPDKQMVCLFNSSDQEESFRFKLPRLIEVRDYWTGKTFGKREGWFSVNDVSPRTAVLLKVG